MFIAFAYYGLSYYICGVTTTLRYSAKAFLHYTDFRICRLQVVPMFKQQRANGQAAIQEFVFRPLYARDDGVWQSASISIHDPMQIL